MIFVNNEIHNAKEVPLNAGQNPLALQALGAQLRAQRKELKVNATVTAEAAGISRVSLHRIGKDKPFVIMGAWTNVSVALGLQLQLQTNAPPVKAPYARRRLVACAHIPIRLSPAQIVGLASAGH